MRHSLLLLSTLLVSSRAVDLPALPANIEIDLLFPRNDTYGTVDNLPIVFALQNAVLAWDFGFQLTWELKNVTPGASSTFSVDFESFLQGNIPKKPAPADPFFLVNSTEKLSPSYYSSSGYGTYRTGIYQLSWGFRLSENCTRDGQFINHTIGASLGGGKVVFTIASGSKPVDLTDGGPCPVAGTVIGIQSNLTGCAHIDNTGVQANPCNINIDSALASSLSAQLPAITVSTTSKPSTTTASKTTALTGTRTSSSATTSSTNNAPNSGNTQTVAAIFAGVAGFCAMLV